MKKKLRLICFHAFFIMSIFSCNNNELDYSYQATTSFQEKLECMNMDRPSDSYNYPIYPLMDRWREFQSKEEMKKACVVPMKQLQKMSTQAIIQAFWEYPFFIEYMLREDHWQEDFEFNIDENSYNVLKSREDAGHQLLERYRVMPSMCKSILYPKAFEILFSQSPFLSQLSAVEKKEVIQLAFEKDSLRQEHPEHAGSLSRVITWFFIGRVMHNAKYAPFMNLYNKNENLKIFLETSFFDRRIGWYYEETIPMFENIITCGVEFIK